MTKPKPETETPTTGLPLLRVPFPAHQINQLPRGNVMLDFVGHAALTDRLLDADPEWNWEPLAIEEGLPKLDEVGGLWIKLTVCGVTRLGYGHAGSKQGGDAVKELIGDALRNAAMRFGAALDLWHKGDLHIAEAPVDSAPPPAPEGYEDWLLTLPKAATSTAALQKQWRKSGVALRKHLTATDSQWWADLKAIAAAASEAAAQ
jgi:hypothetical protein|tara:strand:- start:22 stop:633 length:612 start_codon:yes stop_codon:yes gene_type:complete